MVKQKTIKTEISLTGVGLHTGKEVKMTFKPATVNNGFTFVRVDLEGGDGSERVAATVERAGREVTNPDQALVHVGEATERDATRSAHRSGIERRDVLDGRRSFQRKHGGGGEEQGASEGTHVGVR